VWAFGKAHVRHKAFFKAVCAPTVVDRFVRGLNTQELSNAVWAAAKLGVPAEDLFKAVAAEATGKVQQFATGELSNLIWAFSQASVVDEPLFKAVASDALTRLPDFNAQQQYNLLWGFMVAFTRDVGVYHCGCGRVLVRI
jgi:hypothetical protein